MIWAFQAELARFVFVLARIAGAGYFKTQLNQEVAGLVDKFMCQAPPK